MNSPKAKDRILVEIKANKPHYEIEGLYDVLPELESERYVDVWWDEQHVPIRVKLSDKGKYFVAKGGFFTQRKQHIKAKIQRCLLWLLAILIAALIEESVRVKLIPLLFHE